MVIQNRSAAPRGRTKARAVRHGVAGWVRNLNDGQVEAFLHGPEHAVSAVVKWARMGPALASVADVQVETPAGEGPLQSGFEVRPTK